MSQLHTTRELEKVMPHLSGRHQNWIKCGLIEPADRPRRPSRRGNRHSVEDLVAVAIVFHLFETGLSTEEIRAVITKPDAFSDHECDDFDREDPGRKISRWLKRGFNGSVTISRGFDGQVEVIFHRSDISSELPPAVGTCSLTVVDIASLHKKIAARIAEYE